MSRKAKFEKEAGLVTIYEKRDNSNNIHKKLDFESFKKLYYSNQ